MRYEFHSHTFLSDGELHPIEHIRRAHHAGHGVVALTDHVGVHDVDRVVPVLVRECEAAMADWKIVALPGVEITHVPPRRIAGVAKAARKAGAKVVVVHGETVNEPVVRGTNAAAVACADVDVLAHPGFLTAKDAEAAGNTGVFLELTGKKAHGYTNGHLARLIERMRLPFLVNGDVHSPEQFLDEATARTVALGSGLPKAWAEKGLRDFPRALAKRRA
jgi:putative hydrolase